MSEPPFEWEQKPHESHAADAAINYYRDRWVYDPISGHWHTWVGTHWQPSSYNNLMATLKADVDASMRPICTGVTTGFYKHIEEQMSWVLKHEEWNEHRHLIPMQNGVFDTTTDTMIDAHPHQYFNWALPYAYDPDAQCPTFFQFLDHATRGKQETINVLRAWFNCLIRGNQRFQKYMEVVGPGGTGKSTLLDIATYLVGECNVHSTELKTLEKNQFENSALWGKKLLTISDSERYGGSAEKLKSLTGNDKIRFEAKYKKEIFQFQPQCLVMIAANSVIQTTDLSSGLARRRLPIKMDNLIAPADRDPDMKAKLQAEAAGIFNWAISFSSTEVTHSIINPGPVMLETLEWVMLQSNPVASWIRAKLEYDALETDGLPVGDKSCRSQDALYPNYVEWCENNGQGKLSSKRLVETIVDYSHYIGRTTVQNYQLNELDYIAGYRFKRFQP